jgi:hypothetical protein
MAVPRRPHRRRRKTIRDLQIVFIAVRIDVRIVPLAESVLTTVAR